MTEVTEPLPPLHSLMASCGRDHLGGLQQAG
jgi:hypothetical protein